MKPILWPNRDERDLREFDRLAQLKVTAKDQKQASGNVVGTALRFDIL
jgi:hypothetical protein